MDSVIDVDPLTPEAQPLVARIADIYIRHTRPWFVGLLTHGSALKGGVIPGCSDIDLHLHLEPSAFSWHGHLPPDVAFGVRADMVELDITPFRYVQCYPVTPKLRDLWVGPIPGAYHMVAGELPVPEATADDLIAAAHAGLQAADTNPAYLWHSLLGRGAGRASRNLRLMCTKVWPVVHQVLALSAEDPIEVWSLTKERAIASLPEDEGVRAAAAEYYRALLAYYPQEPGGELARQVALAGIDVIASAKAWYAGLGASV